MRYAQIKKGNKLHLVYEFTDNTVSQPVCGMKADNYRLTINLPMGSACKNCLRRLNSKAFDENKFIQKHS